MTEDEVGREKQERDAARRGTWGSIHPFLPPTPSPPTNPPDKSNSSPSTLGAGEVILNLQNCSIHSSVPGLSHCAPSLNHQIRKFALNAPEGEQLRLGKNLRKTGVPSAGWRIQMLVPAPQTLVMLLTTHSRAWMYTVVSITCSFWLCAHILRQKLRSSPPPNSGSLENTFVKIFFTPER